MGVDVMLKVLNRFFVLFSISLIGCTEQMEYTANFSDGLPEPDKTEFFDLPDDYGIKSIDVFYIDINNDGVKDIVKRGRFITGTAHSYTFYDMYSAQGDLIAHLTTQESADCVLRAYKFQLRPFKIIEASRPVGKDYIEPTKVKLEKFEIKDNKLEPVSSRNYRPICDVRYLLDKQ